MCEKLGIYFEYADNNSRKWNIFINNHKVNSVEQVIKDIHKYYIIIAIENYEPVVKQLIDAGLEESIHFAKAVNFDQSNLISYFQRHRYRDTVILGDCMATTVSFDEDDKRSLKSLISNYLGMENCVSLTLNGTYMRAYYSLLKELLVNQEVKQCILLLDISILAPKYHLLAKAQHVGLWKEICKYAEAVDREFYDFIMLAEKREKGNLVDFSVPNREQLDSDQKILQNKRNHLLLNYAFQIATNGESIHYLKKIKNLCDGSSIDLKIVLLPVNFQQGKALAGDKFIDRLNNIICKLYEVIESKEKQMLDLIFLLENSDFISIRSISEGMKVSGRVRTANEIIKFLEK